MAFSTYRTNMYKKIKIIFYKILILTGITNLKYFKICNMSTSISEEKSIFIELNKKNWENDAQISNNNGLVLIEGFLASYGPNYLLRTGIIGKAIEEEMGFEPIVILKDYLELEFEKVQLYKSFNIKKFASERDFKPSLIERLYIYLFAKKIFHTLNQPEDLLKLEFKNIKFGDLLYDTILKEIAGTVSINEINRKYFPFIYNALFLIITYTKFLNSHNVKIYVSTHSQYLAYGLLLRVCISKKIPVIETTDIQLWLHQSIENGDNISSTKYHEYLRKEIRFKIGTNVSLDNLSELEIMLRNRFEGNFQQSDVQLAYKGKKVYSKADLFSKLKIKNGYPFVYVFAHVFADAPQGLSDGMLYRDYYTWLKETIKQACKIKGVNWIVKPHPSNKFYNESGLVEEIVTSENAQNIYLCPSDLSPASVVDTALAIVTAQGTVGIEYSCMGIPVILASKPFYSGFGFTIDPVCIEDYENTLKGVLNLSRLNEDQVIMAKKVFAAFMGLQQTDTSLITTDVLYTVWGGEGLKSSSDKAFSLINEKLENINLKKYSLYSKTELLLGDIKISCY
jgi:hypothetical protein